MKENKEITGVCPICGEAILENDKVYECAAKCGFRIFKDVLGTAITVDDLNALLEGSETEEKTMLSKKGTEFTAKLKLKSNLKELEFVFPSAKVEGKKVGVCPKCGKNVVATDGKFGKYYRCEECDFKIGGTIAGKTISEANAKLLLTQKETKVIKGFTSSKGKNFDAKLKIDEDNKVVFAFEE